MLDGKETQRQIEELIDELESYAEKSPWFLQNKIVIPDEEFFRLTQTIRENLPAELNEARSMLDKRDLILKNAQDEHRRIMESAERRLEDLTSEEQVVVASRQQADKIVNEGALEAESIKRDALRYTAEMLQDFESRMLKIMSEINNGRAFIDAQMRDIVDDDDFEEAEHVNDDESAEVLD